MKRTPYLLSAVFCILFMGKIAGQGNNSGYQGKHWLLKLDAVTPILDRGAAGEVEWVFHHNIAATLFVQYSNTQYSQKLLGYELHKGVSFDDKATVQDFQVGLGAKIYFSNSMPAPKRNYFFANYILVSFHYLRLLIDNL